jgi:hypothetical protein
MGRHPHVEAATRIGEWLRSDTGPGGECPYGDAKISMHGQLYFTVCVQWWGGSKPRWRQIRDILRGMGATEIRIIHALYDEMNDEEDGKGPCGASLEVTFSMPDDDGIDTSMQPFHLISHGVDRSTGALVTAEEATNHRQKTR